MAVLNALSKAVPRDPPAEIRFTVLDLDMDMDGVQDESQFTHEITPGGFIPLQDVVKITLREPVPTLYSLLPIDADHPVTLRAISGGSKIRIWENESKTGDPVSLPATYTSRSEFPKDLWVEGFQTSSSVRDVTLAMEYTIAGHTFDDRIKITVVELDLEWETYLDNTLIDPHPAVPPNGGKRIFPGKKTYNDPNPSDRKKARVKGILTPAVDNRKVYFSWWDVDDPTTDPNIDTNGSTGEDNRGSGESLSSDHAVTNGSGVARVTFTVAMQPGDNYRIAGSISSTRLGQMTQAMADTVSPPDGVVLSDMLTTWRKLHVERDSMQQVATTGPEQNWVTGVFDDESCSYDPNTNTTIVDLGQDLADCWEETKADHFVGGRFLVSGDPSWYSPLQTISDGDDEIKVTGNCLPGGVTPYYLMDEDDWNILPRLPDTGKLNSIFDDCYIQCVNDAPGSSSDVGFKRNLRGATTEAGDVTNASDRGSEPYEAGDYWVVYVLSGFQPGYTYDWDPNSDGGGPGCTEESHYEASVVFLENIRDCGHPQAILEQQAVVHEIGHQILESGAHTDNTIMDQYLPVPFWQEKFSPSDIATIRSQTSSPGN